MGSGKTRVPPAGQHKCCLLDIISNNRSKKQHELMINKVPGATSSDRRCNRGRNDHRGGHEELVPGTPRQEE